MAQTLIEHSFAQERLMVITMASEIENMQDDLVDLLFRRIQQAPNVNIRLAATEALMGYGDKQKIKNVFLISLKKQKSTLVQRSMPEVLIHMHERGKMHRTINGGGNHKLFINTYFGDIILKQQI